MFSSACACPVNPSVACVVPENVRQAPQDPASLDPVYTRNIAQLALTQITSLGLPSDPSTYTITYAYVTRANPALNHAMNEAIGERGTIDVAELERLYQRFFWQARWETGVHRAGEVLTDELSQIVGMLEASVAATGSNQQDLATASQTLADQKLERATVRAVVDRVAELTQRMQAEQGRLAIHLKKSIEEVAALQANLDALQAESLIDPLTGIGNRKRFDVEIDARLKRAGGQPFSLLMVDIDNFKSFNDRYGHQLGDDVLRLVSQTIAGAIRKEDVAARYGGEEIAVLLPGVSAASASAVAEKIRLAIAGRELVRRNSRETIGKITVSIGVAESHPGDDAQSFIARADERLYVAKRNGRNMVVSHDTAKESRASEDARTPVFA